MLLSADLSLSLSNSTKNNEEDDNMTNRAAFLVLRLNPYISIHVEAQNAVLFRLLRTRFADCFYKFVEEKTYSSIHKDILVHQMYEKVCNLDVSPYERNTNTIRDLFQKQVTKLIDNDN